MEEESKGLGEYLDIFLRRKYLVIIPALILSIIAVVVVKLLPSTYKSEGLILIEAQEIPIDLVKSTVTSYADQRIQVIKQRIMTTSNVMEVVKKFELYKEMRKKSPSSQVVAEFRSNMAVKMVEANVTDPRSGRKKRASIAFTVSFLDPSPKVAQIVANELVTKFLTENARTRTERAAETESFLEEEATKFQKKIQDLEKNIADFKNQYSDSLPELLQYNLSTVERLQDELAANRNQVVALKDQVAAFTIEQTTIQRYLSATTPSRAGPNTQPPSPLEVQLAETKAQYSSLLTRYSKTHPDVIRLKKQVASLESQLGISSSEKQDIESRLTSAESALADLKQRYSESHPDVKAAANKVKIITEELESYNSNSSSQSVSQAENQSTRGQVNPLYVQLETKIKLIEREVQRLIARQSEVREKLADFEQRVVQTHQVKRAYDELIRDHANHLSKYQELKAKQLEAELAQNLESENKGESFSLIEPPQVPTEAEKPNRPKLMVLGVGASFAFGLGLAFLFELLFGGVRGHREIAKITGSAPMIVLPVINTNNDLRKKRNKKYRLVFYVVLLMVVGVVAFHMFVMNLEIFWFKLMRKISLM